MFYLKKIPNLKGHPNCITGLKVMAILLNGWILLIGGVVSGLVFNQLRFFFFFSKTVSILNIQIHSDLLNRGSNQTRPMRSSFFPMSGKTKELATPVVEVDILTNQYLKT